MKTVPKKNPDEITLMELNAVLGARIRMTLNEDLTPEQRHEENQQSAMVLGLAKQTINIADVTLRAEKLLAQNKALEESRINRLLGE